MVRLDQFKRALDDYRACPDAMVLLEASDNPFSPLTHTKGVHMEIVCSNYRELEKRGWITVDRTGVWGYRITFKGMWVRYVNKIGTHAYVPLY